ncbi:MAG: glycosyltransferase family 4 protein [Candidatus Binatia bacterium]
MLVFPAAPLPFGDTAARWFHLLARDLLAHGHEVACLTVSDEPAAKIADARAQLEAVAPAGRLSWHAFPLRGAVHPLWRKLRNAGRPFSELVYAPGFRDALAAELRRGYDVLHLEQLWSGWAGLGVPRSLLNVHHLEVIDLEHAQPATLAERKTHWQMRRATRRLLRRAPAMRLFTPRLLDRVRTFNDAARCWVVPFALDLGLYPLQPVVDEPVVGLLGSMHWPPSRSAAERLVTRLWPRVKARAPRARLLVAGWNARRYLADYASLPDVSIEENLASPADFFSRVSVLAYAPGRGSGMKIKVMEAMAYGVPVVTTSEGVEGMDVADGAQAFVAEEDDVLAERVVTLLDDRATRLHLREAARGLLEERYTPGPVMARMMDVYGHVARCA